MSSVCSAPRSAYRNKTLAFHNSIKYSVQKLPRTCLVRQHASLDPCSLVQVPTTSERFYRSQRCLRRVTNYRSFGATRAQATKTTTEDEQLIRLAQEFVETGTGFGSPARPELIAEDFVFRGPVIGPLCKKDFLFTLGVNKVYEAFPDLQSGAFGYTIDPLEPRRVWFFTRYSGTNTGTINLGPVQLAATKQPCRSGPEANSVMFDEAGRVRLLTVGYIADRDWPGALSDGGGALFGLLNAIGIRLPTGAAFRNLQKVATFFTKFVPPDSKLGIKQISDEDDIPTWYKQYVPKRRGAEGM